MRNSRGLHSAALAAVGANSGIGYELVRLLTAKPEVQKVYLGARSEKSGKEAQ